MTVWILAIYILLIYFFDGRDANDNLTTYNNNMQRCRYCNFTCSNKENNTVVIVTAFDNWTMVNVPIEKDIIIHVFYKCDKQPASNMVNFSKYRYQKICGDKLENCLNWPCDHNRSRFSINKGQTPVVNVSLVLPSDTESFKVSITKCENEPIIFDFNNESISLINDSRNYIFTANNLRKLPITLTIEKFRSDPVANIVFNVTKQQVRECPTINQKYCSHLCKENQMRFGQKCMMKVDKKEVEIASQSQNCGFKANASKIGTCEHMKSIRNEPCKPICVDLPNCSFMCLIQKGTEYTEIGYKGEIIANIGASIGKYFGSGNWTIDNIPKEMVYVNECEMNSKLCSKPSYCWDKPVGFQCLDVDYNEKECKSIKNRFAHCSETFDNYEEISQLNDSINLELRNLTKDLNDTINKSMDFNKCLAIFFKSFNEMMEILNRYKRLKKKNLISNYSFMSAVYFYRIVNTIDQTLQDLLLLVFKSTTYEKNNSSHQAYAIRINESVRKYSIPVSDNGTDNAKQFVKFEIGDVRNKSDLIATYLRYVGLSPWFNEKEIKQKASGSNLTENRTSSKRYRYIFRNSDIISLALDVKAIVKVQFKLEKSFQIYSENWRWSYDDECGYLDSGNYWSIDGCTKQKNEDNVEFCECNHLSNFAMILAIKDINQDHKAITRYLSIIGGIINVVSLILFLIFILLINSRDKLRLDQLNIAICLLCGFTLFLLGCVTKLDETLCKVSAIVIHFLLVSAFVWKLILGINVVRMISLSSYQNEDWMVKYRLVILGIGYAIPIMFAAGSGGAYWNYYGFVGDDTCWIRIQEIVLYIFLIPIGVILAINLIVLFFIAITLIRNYINTRKTKVTGSNELLVFLQLVVSMGLTWVPLCFSVKYLAAMYAFLIFSPLQGLMMFLFVVVINRENREKVSAYLIQRYSSFRSKSTTSTDTKSTSRSRSVHSKNTDPTQSLLSDNNKEKEAYEEQVEFSMGKLIDHNVTQPVMEPVC